MNTLAHTEGRIFKQLDGLYSQRDARLTANVSRMILEVIADSPIGILEDHVMLPALAAVLGHLMQNAKNAIDAKEELKEVLHIEMLPSLYPGDDALMAIVALTNRAHAPMDASTPAGAIN